jgi:hypothetical protein
MSAQDPGSGKIFEEGKERGEDRRQEQQPVESNRREATDRRNARFGIKYVTLGSLIEIEDWLDDQCSGIWELVLLDMDDELERKEVQIMFEHKSDKEKFIAQYS